MLSWSSCHRCHVNSGQHEGLPTNTADPFSTPAPSYTARATTPSACVWSLHSPPGPPTPFPSERSAPAATWAALPLSAHCRSCTTTGAASGQERPRSHIWCRLSMRERTGQCEYNRDHGHRFLRGGWVLLQGRSRGHTQGTGDSRYPWPTLGHEGFEAGDDEDGEPLLLPWITRTHLLPCPTRPMRTVLEKCTDCYSKPPRHYFQQQRTTQTLDPKVCSRQTDTHTHTECGTVWAWLLVLPPGDVGGQSCPLTLIHNCAES